MNIIFSSQLINFFITGRYIFFCKYYVSWQCGLVKICAYLNCGSVQVFCKNISGTVKVSTKFYNTKLPDEMIFTKEDVSTSDEQVEKLTREYNIHYRACIGSLIYLLSTRVDLSFAVHKLAKLSANPGKVHFEGLVHLLIYIRDNKTLGLK